MITLGVTPYGYEDIIKFGHVEAEEDSVKGEVGGTDVRVLVITGITRFKLYFSFSLRIDRQT